MSSIEVDATSEAAVNVGDVVFNSGVPIGIALESAEEGGSVRVMISGIATMDAASLNTNTTYDPAALDGTYALMATGAGYTDNVYITDGQVVGVDWARTSGEERFPDDVVEKAWKLLEDYMNPDQYFAFMEESTIEIENSDAVFRLLINKVGNFTILEGERGNGIVSSSGRIRSYEYPLGDEIATFIDHFRYKTKELIAKWNCGTYGIVKDGQRR